VQDTGAFVDLYAGQYPRIVAYAQRRLGTPEEAEDCAAEVFRLAWEQPATPGVGWLFVTAKNLVYARCRQRRRQSGLIDRLGRDGAAGPSEDTGQAVRAALGRLEESQRELLMAFYWDDLPGARCAELLGCSTAAVWVRLHRARRALRAVLLADEVAPPTVAAVAIPTYQGELS